MVACKEILVLSNVATERQQGRYCIYCNMPCIQPLLLAIGAILSRGALTHCIACNTYCTTPPVAMLLALLLVCLVDVRYWYSIAQVKLNYLQNDEIW